MLHLATIGTSWITEQFIEAALETGYYALSAVYSRTVERAQALAQKHGGGYGTDDLDAMFADVSVDIVYIASPNKLHHAQAIAALEAGKHVIVEKPIFTSEAEWTEAFALAKEKDLYLFEAARHIHTKNYKHLKALIDFKRQQAKYPFLGANLNIGQYSSKYDRYNQALADDESVPNVFNPAFDGGSLLDLGVYPLYVTIDLFGEPVEVSYHPVKGVNDIDLYGHTMLNYEDFNISIFASKAVHSNLSSEFYFDNEVVEVGNITDIDRVTVHSAKEPDLLNLAYIVDNPLYDEAKRFAEIIADEDDTTYNQLKTTSKIVNHVLDQLK